MRKLTFSLVYLEVDKTLKVKVDASRKIKPNHYIFYHKHLKNRAM